MNAFPPPPELALLDTFNSVYSMATARREEIEAYADHLRRFRESGAWVPLKLPDSWREFAAWPDALDAIPMFQKSGCRCVTLSNGPIDLQIDLARRNNMTWDWMVPLEAYHVYKPDVRAYLAAIGLLKVDPRRTVMITANKDFGDLEAAEQLGMQTAWIDRKCEDPERKAPTNLVELHRSIFG